MNSARTSKSNELPRAERDERKDQELTVDELRLMHAALTEENRKLKLLAEYRSAFLARLAHELRTPLTSILGFAEIMLSQEELTEAQRNFCERIQNSAQQLQMNFNQLADLSRLEGGQSELQREEFSLDDMLRESCAAVARQAQKQKVGLQSEAGPDLPLIISTTFWPMRSIAVPKALLSGSRPKTLSRVFGLLLKTRGNRWLKAPRSASGTRPIEDLEIANWA